MNAECADIFILDIRHHISLKLMLIYVDAMGKENV